MRVSFIGAGNFEFWEHILKDLRQSPIYTNVEKNNKMPNIYLIHMVYFGKLKDLESCLLGHLQVNSKPSIPSQF